MNFEFIFFTEEDFHRLQEEDEFFDSGMMMGSTGMGANDDELPPEDPTNPISKGEEEKSTPEKENIEGEGEKTTSSFSSSSPSSNAYLSRYLVKCCENCLIYCYENQYQPLMMDEEEILNPLAFQPVPYHLIAYLHFALLLRTGGIFTDFSFYFINPLEKTQINQVKQTLSSFLISIPFSSPLTISRPLPSLLFYHISRVISLIPIAHILLLQVVVIAILLIVAIIIIIEILN